MLRSNISAGAQGLFSGARRRIGGAVKNFKEMMNEAPSKPYRDRTPQERLEFDLSMMEDEIRWGKRR